MHHIALARHWLTLCIVLILIQPSLQLPADLAKRAPPKHTGIDLNRPPSPTIDLNKSPPRSPSRSPPKGASSSTQPQSTMTSTSGSVQGSARKRRYDRMRAQSPNEPAILHGKPSNKTSGEYMAAERLKDREKRARRLANPENRAAENARKREAWAQKMSDPKNKAERALKMRQKYAEKKAKAGPLPSTSGTGADSASGAKR